MGVQFITITVHSSKGAIVPCLNSCMMSKEFEEKEPNPRPTNSTTHSANEEEEDPGMFFVLYPPSKVHTALALPSVANISPRLDQGKKNY